MRRENPKPPPVMQPRCAHGRSCCGRLDEEKKMNSPQHTKASFFTNSGLFDEVESFTELEQRISQLPTNKNRGDAFEVFAEAYLATQKIGQSYRIWPFEALPPSLRKRLGLDTGKDMGVDGVLETQLGDFHAYQVKFRSN